MHSNAIPHNSPFTQKSTGIKADKIYIIKHKLPTSLSLQISNPVKIKFEGTDVFRNRLLLTFASRTPPVDAFRVLAPSAPNELLKPGLGRVRESEVNTQLRGKSRERN